MFNRFSKLEEKVRKIEKKTEIMNLPHEQDLLRKLMQNYE
jgi:hypothetical protein